MTPRQIKDDEDEYQNGHISTRSYIEAVMQSEVKRLEACIESVEKAIDIAKEVLDLRLQGLNHLREEFTKQQGKFVERTLYDERHDALEKQANSLEKRVASTDGLVKALLVMFALGGVGVAVLEFLNK
jgi:hypothetical protein